jgi:hypothetical protein
LRVRHHTDGQTLQQHVHGYTQKAATCYTDEWQGYNRIKRTHSTVCHGQKEWARDDDGDDGNGHTGRAGPKRRGTAKAAKGKRAKARAPAKSNAKNDGSSKADKIRKELVIFLANGPQNRATILHHMKDKKLLGTEQNPLANLSAYLSRWKDLVTNDSEGNWALVP